jgi:hypothetical protein
MALTALDLVIDNAMIHTMDRRSSTAESVGIKGNRIVLVGDAAEIDRACSGSTLRIDVGQKIVLPGLIDAHTHFRGMGVRLNNYLDLSFAASKQGLLERLREFAAGKKRDDWIIGTGWDESKWSGDQAFLTREEIDDVVSQSPVALERVDCHLYCVNSRALNMLKLDRPVRGFEIMEGIPTGRLFEDATALVRQAIEPGQKEITAGIKRATQHAYRHGVTSIHQMVVEAGEFSSDLRAYQGLRRDNELGIRALLYFTPNFLDGMIGLGLASGFGDSRLRIGGLKLFSDGSIGAKTAWVTDGYRDEPENEGMSIWDRGELEKLVNRAHENGIQLAIHAIGDRAIELVLGCLERAGEKKGDALRHRVEHDEFVTRSQIERMRNAHIVASMQPNFTGEWGLPDGMYEGRFGRERIETMNPLRWIVDADVPLALGSDCMPFGPLYGIHWAVNAPFPAQRLSVYEAVRGYTMGAAFAGNAEQEVGSIEPGKLADLIMLNGDPFSEPAGVKDMKVEMTLFDGRVVYREDD